jgi:hypothetical protein
MHKPQYEYFAIDCFLADYGHRVIRLPPYHPDLNPIEKIWCIVKTRLAATNVTLKLRDVQKLAEQNFAVVTVEEWTAVESREHEMDGIMERILINADDDDDDDDDDDNGNHAEDLLAHVFSTDCEILKITYKPSLKEENCKLTCIRSNREQGIHFSLLIRRCL